VLALLWRPFSALRPGHPLRRVLVERWVSRANGAFNRRDLNLLRVLFHPELVWDWSHFEGWPEDRVVHGFDEFSRAFLAWREAWGEATFDSSDYRDFGERQMVTAHIRATGSGSGLLVNQTMWQVGSFRAGLLDCLKNYTNEREAIDAAIGGFRAP
jgi:hypothetical protein